MTARMAGTAGAAALTPEALGFEPAGDGWRRVVGGRALHFRRLRSRADLAQVERLQREVFGVSDVDLAAYSILVVIPKTGGEILGALAGERLVGFVTGYGGYVGGRPRLVSDMMAVDPAFRGGLGFALKALQAAVALAAGFEEAIWTVDPLRAANARLNVERLGAYARDYEEDVYGADYAEGLYGGLPTDRLIMTWPLASRRVRERLLGAEPPLAPGALDALPDYAPGESAPRARVAIPGDIDALLARDPDAALRWRLQVRAALQSAFDAGYAITGFAGAPGAPRGYYLLERGFRPA